MKHAEHWCGEGVQALSISRVQISGLPGLDPQVVREVMFDIQQADRRQAEAQPQHPPMDNAQVSSSVGCAGAGRGPGAA